MPDVYKRQGLGFLGNYGLQCGAVASSIAHDSHNLIVAGTNDADMVLAGNTVRKNKGGLAFALNGQVVGELPLPVAGLMSTELSLIHIFTVDGDGNIAAVAVQCLHQPRQHGVLVAAVAALGDADIVLVLCGKALDQLPRFVAGAIVDKEHPAFIADQPLCRCV